MSLASISRTALGLALLVLTTACFAEPEQGTTTTTMATDAATTSDCDPGSFACACLNGVCEPGLACTDDVCLPVGSTTGSDTENSSSVTATSASTTADTTQSTSGTSEGVDTGTSAETTTGAGDTTGMTMACADQPGGASEVACNNCFDCTHENDCQLQFAVCDATPSCNTIATCLRECAISGNCFDDCCAGAVGGAVSAALALQTCREDSCIGGACESYADPLCSM